MSKRLTLNFFVILIACLIWFTPVVWVISLSFQPNELLQKTTTNFLFGFFPIPFTVENYIKMWSSSFDVWVMNSLIVAICATFFTTIFCSMAGYAFARIDFFGRKFIYPLVLAGLMIPGELLFIPLFTQFSSLGLNNTHTGLFLPKLAIPFGVFIMTQYFKVFQKK